MLREKREEATRHAVTALWTVARNWLVDSVPSQGLVEGVLLLLGLVRPASLDVAHSMRLVESAVLLAASSLGRHLPLSVIRLSEFTLASQASSTHEPGRFAI